VIKVYTITKGKLVVRTLDKTLQPERSFTKAEKGSIWNRFSEAEKADITEICKTFRGKLA
jgi:hypothetical protein